jgi:DNA-binding Lrp family transcriptional regulator
MKGKKLKVELAYKIELELTEKELKVLDCLIKVIRREEEFIPIKLKKIEEITKIKKRSLIYLLKKLEEKGLISKRKLRGRPLELAPYKKPFHCFYKVRPDIYHLWKISKKIIKGGIKRGEKEN